MSEGADIQFVIPSNMRHYLETSSVYPLLFYEYYNGTPGGFFGIELIVTETPDTVYNSAYITFDMSQQNRTMPMEQAVFYQNYFDVGLILGAEIPVANHQAMYDILTAEFLPEGEAHTSEYRQDVLVGLQDLMESIYLGLPTVMMWEPGVIGIHSNFLEEPIYITDDGAYSGDTDLELELGRENRFRMSILVGNGEDEEAGYTQVGLEFVLTLNFRNMEELQQKLRALVQTRQITHEDLRSIINIEWVMPGDSTSSEDQDDWSDNGGGGLPVF